MTSTHARSPMLLAPPNADPMLRARALLQEGRLLEALGLSDAARWRYEDLLAYYPESSPAEIAALRLRTAPPGR